MRLSRREALVGAAALALAAAGEPPSSSPSEPSDYRMDDYGAPTPLTLAGAEVLTTAQAELLWRAKSAAFIDVLPHVPRPPELPADTIWNDPPHRDIPGSIWLPDTGYGALAPATESYFTRGLAAATGGDRAAPLVIYCQPRCWMSWNAAKRAISLGYTRVAWYPDGVSGWRRAGLALEVRSPAPPSGS